MTVYRIRPVKGYASLLRVERKSWLAWKHVRFASDHAEAELGIMADMEERRRVSRHSAAPTIYKRAYWKLPGMGGSAGAKLVVETVR